MVGFRGCEHKSFLTHEEAAEYLRAGNERYSYLAGENDSAHRDGMGPQQVQQQQQQQQREQQRLSNPPPLSSFSHSAGLVSGLVSPAAASSGGEIALLTSTPRTGTSASPAAPAPAATGGDSGGARSPYFATPAFSPAGRLAGSQAAAAAAAEASGAVPGEDEAKVGAEWFCPPGLPVHALARYRCD